MLAPAVQRIAQQVEIEAKRLAPPTKRWVTMVTTGSGPPTSRHRARWSLGVARHGRRYPEQQRDPHPSAQPKVAGSHRYRRPRRRHGDVPEGWYTVGLSTEDSLKFDSEPYFEQVRSPQSSYPARTF